MAAINDQHDEHLKFYEHLSMHGTLVMKLFTTCNAREHARNDREHYT